MQSISFEEVLDLIIAADPRYGREAYHFIREALDYTQKKIVRTSRNELRHVTGQQLLQGIREYALDQYGPLAVTVFEEWGIHRCEDFGELVFNMVESNLLAKTEKDSREDFRSAYEFDDAFRKPFQPKHRSHSRRASKRSSAPRTHAD